MAKRLIVEIIGNTTGLEHSLRSAENSTTGFGNAATRMGGLVKAGLIAAAGGAVLLGVGLEKSVHAAMDAQASQALLDQQLKSMGISYADHRAQIESTIAKEEQLSGFTKVDLRDAFTTFARSTGDVTQSLNLEALAADVARGRHVDLATATMLVLKAHMGLTGSLRRMGLDVQKVTTAEDALKTAHGKVTQAMKDQAKATDLAATKTELIAFLQQKFAGQAQAYGQTAAGSMDRFRNAVHDLEIALGSGLLPVVASVAGKIASFIDKLTAAPTFRAKIDVVLGAVSNLEEWVVDVGKTLAARIQQAMATTNWTAVGVAVGAAISASIMVTTGFMDKALGAILSWTNAHMGQIAEVGAVMALSIVSKLTDPAFWGSHWQLALGILALAIGGSIGKLGPIAAKLGEEIVLRLGVALEAMSPAVLRAVETAGRVMVALGPKLVAVIGVAAVVAVRAAFQLGESVVKAIIAALGNLIPGVEKKLSGMLSALQSIANTAYQFALSIGTAITNGILNGIGGLAGALKSKVVGAATDAYNATMSFLHAKSPSKLFAEGPGKSIAEGIVEGFLLGWANVNLPAKMNAKLQTALQAAQQTIQGMQGNYTAAWSRLAQYALNAFDAETTAGLAKIQAKIDAAKAKIDATFRQGGAETSAEASARAMREAHDEAARQKAIADAQAALATAQAGGDPAAILAAQQALDDALYAESQFQADRMAAQSRQLADDEANKRKAALDAQQVEMDKQYQARRDLQRQNLEDMLNELEASLQKHPEKWRKIHGDLIKLLGTFGVTFRQAGKDLGDAFATGMEDAFAHVEHTAEAIAQLVAKYLPHSPAEEGPLSKLPDWEGYLTSGLASSGRSAARVLGGSLSGVGGRSVALAGAGGGDVHMHVNVQGSIWKTQELAEAIKGEFARNKMRGGL